MSAGKRRWTTRAGCSELIAAAPRMEFEQALVRLLAAVFVLLGMVFELRGPVHAIDAAPRALAFIAGFIAFAAMIILWILSDPRPSPTRRIIGIVADNVAITYAMLALGDAGAMAFGVYLFVAFGNAFRYGRAYASLSQFLAVFGFGLVLSVSGFWQEHLLIGMGLLIMLIILPLYVRLLFDQMRAGHLKTEQALKECLERERRKS
jgi:two-component system sensor histidine kinase RpfC